MAEVPVQSDAGPGTVLPEVATPDDYAHVQASPAAFGGLIAQGAQEAGAGASKAGAFFGQVNADQVSNNFQSQASTLVENYKKLQGQDALNAQPQVTSDLDNLLKTSRSQLNTPEEQLQFDDFSRRYRTYLNSDIGQHYDQQFLTHAISVNATSENLALQDAAKAADSNNPDGIAHATSDLINARIKQLQVRGEDDSQSRLNTVNGAKQDVLKVQLATIGATDPDRALSILQKNQNIAGTDYGQLYNEFKAKADKQFGISKSTELLGQAASGTVPPASPTPASDDAATLIKGAESFRQNAYWDVNHWRTGYGSDTITLADGTVQPVTAMTQVTQADAERDLSRRVQQTQTGIQGEIGSQTWNGLAPNVKASLTSVAYNYGHLPASVVAAVRTGDPGNVAEAIMALGSDNGGVNQARRLSEAANVLGRFGPSGVETTTGAAPLVQLPPEAQGAPAPPLQPDLESTAAPLPAVASSQTAPVAVSAPPSLKADVFSRILADPDLAKRPEAQAEALANASRLITAKQIADAQNEKDRKDASDKAFGGYVTQALQTNANYSDILGKVRDDPNLLPETKLAFGKTLEKGADVGVEEATKTYGPGFWALKNRLSLPLGDPNRISDPQELLSHAGPGGDLTLAGVDKLSSYVRSNTRSVDDANVNRSILSMEHYANSQVSFDQEITFPGFPPKSDPVGKAIFEAQFLPAYEHTVDNWIKSGKDPWDPKGPLSKDFVDKMIAPMRSKTEMARARLDAQEQSIPGENITPPDVNPINWQTITGKPPILPNGSPWTYANWSGALNYLRANPTSENKSAFDKHFAASGYTADQVLTQLKVAQ